MAATPPTGYGSKNPWLRMGPMRRVIGIVLAMIGAVWFLQGIGVAQGSFMSNNPTWAVIGAIVAVIGVAVLYRAHNAARRLIAEEEAAERETRSG